MVQINKYEKELLHQRFPHLHITRTCRQKSERHRYYCAEDRNAMRYLYSIRHPDAATEEAPYDRKHNFR